MRVPVKGDPTDYTDQELRSLAMNATEAALFTLLPHFQAEDISLNKYDHEMIRVAIKLMIMRKVRRPIIG